MHLTFTFYKKHFLYFSLSFVLFTIIGTISHEYGHIAAAKSLGYETTLHYGSMNYKPKEKTELYDLYKINNEVDFLEKEKYNRLQKIATKNSFIITLGGPLQTMLTGLIGLLIIFIRRKKIIKSGFQFTDWLAVFLSLFWLREVFNLFMGFAFGILNDSQNYFVGDEVKLSKHLNLPLGTIPILFGAIGMLISLFVIFKVIPLKFRFTFILAGFIGGISGFYLWLYYLGPIVLP